MSALTTTRESTSSLNYLPLEIMSWHISDILVSDNLSCRVKIIDGLEWNFSTVEEFSRTPEPMKIASFVE